VDSNGIPFYIGKGKGKRAWSLKRTTTWIDYVNSIGDYKVEIVKDKLCESEAIELEEKMISDIGISNLTNIYGKGSVRYIKNDRWLNLKQKIDDVLNLAYMYNNFEKIIKDDFFKENIALLNDLQSLEYKPNS
jgi:hypothetical protein